jgi:hypothetical protein
MKHEEKEMKKMKNPGKVMENEETVRKIMKNQRKKTAKRGKSEEK